MYSGNKRLLVKLGLLFVFIYFMFSISTIISAATTYNIYGKNGDNVFEDLTLNYGDKLIFMNDNIELHVIGDLTVASGAIITYDKSADISIVNINVEGNATINGVINLAGEDGDNGDNGWSSHRSGYSGDPGLNGKLLNLFVGNDLVINGTIDTTGGSGGNGGIGKNSNWDDVGADGGNGGYGGDGGAITLNVGKDIKIGYGNILTYGGDGGTGGKGGNASNNHSGGDGGTGGNAGDGGSITLNTKEGSLIMQYGFYAVSKLINVTSLTDIGNEPDFSSSIRTNSGSAGSGGAGGEKHEYWLIVKIVHEGGEDGEGGNDGLAGNILLTAKSLNNYGGYFVSGDASPATVIVGYLERLGLFNPSNVTLITDNIGPMKVSNLKLKNDDGTEIYDNGDVINNNKPLLTWDEPEDRSQSDVPISGVKKYYIFLKDENGILLQTKETNDTEIKLQNNIYSGLSDGEYVVNVSAVDMNNTEGDISDDFYFTIDTQEPQAPVVNKNLIETNVTNSTVTIYWSEDSDETIENYYVSLTAGGKTYQKELSGKQLSCQFTGLDPNKRVYYSVQSSDIAGNMSHLSRGIVVTSPVKAEINRIINGGEYGSYSNNIEIYSLGDKTSGYCIKRSRKLENEEFSDDIIVKSWFSSDLPQAEIITITDSMDLIEPHQEYRYTVETKNQSGIKIEKSNAYYTDTVNIPPIFSQILYPTNNVITNQDLVELSLIPCEDGDHDLLTYKFHLNYLDSSGSWNNYQLNEQSLFIGADKVSIDTVHLAEGRYRWTVSVDDGYVDSPITPSEEYYYFTTDYTAPDIPTFSIGNYTNQNEITIKDISVDGKTSQDTEKIEAWEINSEGEAELLDSFTPVSEKTVTLSQGEGVKQIKLVAIDTAGNRSESSLRTVILDFQAPEEITTLQYSGGKSSVIVKWDSPADNGLIDSTSGIDHYMLSYLRGFDQNQEYVSVVVPHVTNNNRQSYTIAGLAANEAINVKIKAVDRAGNESEWYQSNNNGYSLPEKGEITDSIFNIEKKENIYLHQISLEISPVKAADYQIKWDKVNKQGEIVASGLSDPDTNVTVPAFNAVVEPHGRYEYYLITRNPSMETVVSNKFPVEVPNNPPGKPVIDAENYRYINQLPIKLVTGQAVDYDLDPLHYYFTLYDKNGNLLLDDAGNAVLNHQESNIADDPLSYLLNADLLTDGSTYQWQVGISDGYMFSDKDGDGNLEKDYIYSDLISFTVDLTPPEVEITPSNTELQDALAELTVAVNVTDMVSGIAEISYYWSESIDEKVVINPGSDIYEKDINIEAPSGSNQLHFFVTDNAGNETSLIRSYLVDKTAPVLENLMITGQVIDGNYYTTHADSLYATWKLTEDCTAIAKYRYAVISADEINDIQNIPADRFIDVTVNSINEDYDQVAVGSYTQNEKYYFAVEGINLVGRSTGIQVSSNGIIIDSLPPEINYVQISGVITDEDKLYLANLQDLTVDASITDAGSGVDKISYALVKRVNELENANWYPAITDLKDSVDYVNGQAYYLVIKAVDKLGQTALNYSDAIVIDQSAPLIKELFAGTKLEIDSPTDVFQVRPGCAIPINLEIIDETDMESISYSIGTSPGSNNISQQIYPDLNGWLPLNKEFIQQFYLNEELADGKYYLTVKVRNKAGHLTQASSNPIQIDSSLPVVPIIYDDGRYSGIDTELHFSWELPDSEQTVNTYEYQIVDASNNPVEKWKPIEPQSEALLHNYVATGLELENGLTYYVKLRARFADDSLSGVGQSDGVTIDVTPPVNVYIEDGSFTVSDRLHLEWSAEDPESAINKYAVIIGTTPGGSEVSQGWIELDSSGEGVLKNLSLETNKLYFTTLRVTNGSNLITEVSGDGFRVDDTPPTAPLVLDQGAYTNLKNEMQYLRFTWQWSEVDPESGVQEYQVVLLNSRELTAGLTWQSVGLDTEVVFDSSGMQLIDGQRYYLAVKTINKAGFENVGFSDGIMIDRSAPTPPAVDDLLDYQSAEQRSLKARFTASDEESGIDHYEYSIGTLAHPNLLISGEYVNGEEINVQNLVLTSGEVYYFTVKAINKAMLVSMEGRSDGIKIIDQYPEIYNLEDYGDYSTFNNQIVVSWDSRAPFAPIDHYEYAVSTSAQAATFDWKETTEKQVIIKPEDIGLQNFADGAKYYVYVKAVNAAGIETPSTEFGRTDGIMIDSTPPEKPQVNHPDSYTTERFTLKWQTVDEQSGISRYRYAVGLTRGGSEVTGGWKEINTDQLTYEQTMLLTLEHNQRYFVSVQAQNKAGLWSEMAVDEGVVADLTPPIQPTIVYNNNYVNQENKLDNRLVVNNVKWISGDEETGIIGYRYQLVEARENIDWTAAKTYTASTSELETTLNLELKEEGKYYLALQTENRLGVWSESGFSQELTVDYTSPVISLEHQLEMLVTNSDQETGLTNFDIPWQLNEKAEVYLQLLRPDGSTEPEIGYQVQSYLPGNHSYHFVQTMEGIYHLKIYAVDPAGNRGEELIQKIRLNAKPRINLGGDRSSFKGREVEFAAAVNDPDGYIVEYIWNFGNGEYSQKLDGVSGEEISITAKHQFTELDVYNVTLTCIDNDGGLSIDEIKLEVTNTKAGPLVMPEIWSDTMVLEDTVIIPAESSFLINPSLTIMPGTTIIFPEDTELIIEGPFMVEGLEGDRVVFTTDSISDSWQGIKVNEGAPDVSIKSATIERAVRGLIIAEGNGYLEDIYFSGNEVGLHLYQSSPLILNCKISNNEFFGIKEDGVCEPTLINNLFINNLVGDYYDYRLTILTPAELEIMNQELTGGVH